MKIDLSNKIALVTGASGELGPSMVRTLNSCGALVVIHYFWNKEKALKLLDEIEGQGMIVQADVTIRESVFQMRDEILKELKSSLQIVINNAVIRYPWKSILDQPQEDFESQFRSSVLHNVFQAQAFLPCMKDKKYGRFIGINTECSVQSLPTQGAYVASKRGMDGLYRVLAREVGEYNITVNQIAPGWMISDKNRLNKNKKELGAENYEKGVPLKRRGDDQQVANMVAFLASDLASFVSGAFIPVCGGNVMTSI